MKQKLLNIKHQLIALWWFLTRKNYYILSYNGRKDKSLETFNMVVFDPPHLLKVGQNSWLCKKYGKLPENWQAFINDSIHEGMRVLKTNGTLIFKWNEQQIKVSDVLKAITDYKPIFGHRTTVKNQTIWMAFMK